MTDPRSDLEQESRRFVQPDEAFERLIRRRADKRLHQRITAGVVGIMVFVAVALGTWVAVERETAKVPGDDPSPSDLGIFSGVRGWIAYGDPDGPEPGIWAIDPTNPDAEPVMLDPHGGFPVAWSSDGSKLLVLRGDRPVFGPGELVVLDADGTETPLAHFGFLGYPGGSFTVDGSQVIYGSRYGIYSVAVDGGSPRLLYHSGGPNAGDPVYQPVFSPDGLRVAFFEGGGDAGNSLWVINVDGTDKHQILGEEEAGRTPWSLQWSPDGTRLAFKRGADRSFGVVNADGSGLTFTPAAIPDLGPGAGPYWSPDGTRLAFATGSDSLAIARPDGTELQELGSGRAGPWNPLSPGPTTATQTEAPAPSTPPTSSVDLGIFAPVAGRIVYGDRDGIWGVDPAAPADPATRAQLTSEAGIPLGWSSDGTRLLIMQTIRSDRVVADGRWDTLRLLVLDADGSETQVAERQSWIPGATISPDGSRVVFATYKALYSVDVGGGRPVVLLEGQGEFEAATFSPDGAKIAYVVGSGDHSHRVWVMNADGSDAHEILANETTLGASHVLGLAWSPAGNRIAFGNDVDTYTFAPDGSGFTQVIANGTQPYWSPDGSQIAFSVPEGFPSRLTIADADGSNDPTIVSGAASGPWNPAPRGAS